MLFHVLLYAPGGKEMTLDSEKIFSVCFIDSANASLIPMQHAVLKLLILPPTAVLSAIAKSRDSVPSSQ